VLATIGGRLAMVHSLVDGAEVTSFDDIPSAPGPVTEIPRIPEVVSAAALRDGLLVFGGRISTRLLVAVVDPFEHHVVSEPRGILYGFRSVMPGAAASDDRGGTMAICASGLGSSARPALEVALLGPDGALIGDAVPLDEGEGVGSCYVARTGLDRYVAVWRSGSRMRSAEIRVRR
jgi:hypothetical protein